MASFSYLKILHKRRDGMMMRCARAKACRVQLLIDARKTAEVFLNR